MPTTTTPDMHLVLPVVGQEPDPAWATELDAAFAVIDSHDHTSTKGVQVPSAGINVNGDISANQFNLTNLRSTQYRNGVAVLPISDIDAIYAVNGDLYWNNAAGTAVRITNGAALNTGALAINVFDTDIISGNLTIQTSDTFTLILVDTSGAPRTILLPAASGVAKGRYYLIKDAAANAGTNPITITPAGADSIDTVAASKIISANNGSCWIASDGTSKWFTVSVTDASATVNGLIRLAGDIGGSASSPRVVKINSASVPVAGSLTTGNVLQVSGGSALSYGAVNLAGGSNFVTGLLPAANLDATNLTSSGGVVTVQNPIAIQGLRYTSQAISGTYTVLQTDSVLSVNTSAPVTINLPSTGVSGFSLIIFDISGLAHTNNISLVPFATHTINGVNATRILSADFGCWRLINTPSNDWIFLN